MNLGQLRYDAMRLIVGSEHLGLWLTATARGVPW